MEKEEINNLKNRYVEKIEYCYEHKYFMLINPKYSSGNFLFDNITEISDISFYDIDKIDVTYSNDNKELEKIVNESLLCFVEDLKKTRNDKPNSNK